MGTMIIQAISADFCYSGQISTLQHICRVSGESRIAGIIGVLYLNRVSKQRMQAMIAALIDLKPRFIIPFHCTEDEASKQRKMALSDKVPKAAVVGSFEQFKLGSIRLNAKISGSKTGSYLLYDMRRAG